MRQDGDYVFMHDIWRNAKPFGADELVSFDILRVDGNGKVAEQWDAMTALVEKTDPDKTAANKALAKAMVEDVLVGKNPSKAPDYISA